MGIPAPLGVSASGLPPTGDQANAVVAGVLTAIGPGLPFAVQGPMNVLVYGSINTALTTTNGSSAASVASGTNIAAGQSINSANVPRGTTWGAFAGVSGTLSFPAMTLWCSGFSLTSDQVTVPPGSNANSLLGATVAVPSNAEGVTLPAGTTVIAIVQADVAPTSLSAGTPGIVQLSNRPTAIPNLDTTLMPKPLVFALTNKAVTTGVDAAAVFTGAAITFSASFQLERSFDGAATWLPCNIGGSGTLAQYTAGTPLSLSFGEPEKGVLYRINCYAYTSGNLNYRLSATGQAATSLSVPTL